MQLPYNVRQRFLEVLRIGQTTLALELAGVNEDIPAENPPLNLPAY